VPVDVNYFAVVVVAIINLILGFLWYGPLFGRQWMTYMNITTPSRPDRAAMAKTTGGSFVGALVFASVLSLVVDWAQAASAAAGIRVGFWAWLGFVATVTINSVLYERRPTGLWALNNAYYLLTYLIAGALLAVWT